MYSTGGGTLPEFLAENAHRFYPLEPTFSDTPSNNNAIPPALLLDLRLIATDNLPDNSTESSTTYLSKVVTDGSHARFYLAANIGDTTVDLGCIATIDSSNAVGDRIDFQSSDNTPAIGAENFVFEGFIIVGDTSVLQQMPPVTDLDKNTGKIYTGCIQHMTRWVAGLRIGSEVLGGVVTLVAGPGVIFDVTGNTVTISCAGAVPPENSEIASDDDIIAEICSIYGVPISSINGVPVKAISVDQEENKAGGDWQICTKDSEGLTVVADQTTSSITINNTLASACCTQDSISFIVDNIAELNERVGLIQSFQTQVETNLNTISAQMVKLG